MHEALDQVRCGRPPLTRCQLSRSPGCAYAPALGVLTTQRCRLALLLWLQRQIAPPESPTRTVRCILGNPSPRPWALLAQFWLYCSPASCGVWRSGAVVSHMVSHGVLAHWSRWSIRPQWRDARRRLTGWLLDRYGAKTLAVLPILSILSGAIRLHGQRHNGGLARWCAGRNSRNTEVTLRGVSGRRPGRQPAASQRLRRVRRRAGRCATARGGALIGWLYDISIGTLVVVVIARTDGPGIDVRDPTLPRVAPPAKEAIQAAQRNGRLVCDSMLDRHAQQARLPPIRVKWRPGPGQPV